MANCNGSCSGRSCASGFSSCRNRSSGSCSCTCGNSCGCNANVNSCARRANGCSALQTACSCGNRSGCNKQGSYGCLNSIPCRSSSCGCAANWRIACMGYDPLNICQNYENFPFYNGPCGAACPVRVCNPCDPDCIDDCDDGNDGGDSGTTTALAVFTAEVPLDVCAGGSIPFTAEAGNSDDFEIAPDGIRLHRSGIYLVTYTVHVPPYQNFSSRMYLSLDGSPIAASRQEVAKTSDGASTGSTAQALVQAAEGSMLSLISDSAFKLIHSNSAANAFTLSILRVV